MGMPPRSDRSKGSQKVTMDRVTEIEPVGLRATLEAARAEHGLTMKALTVLAAQHDPFRIDTPAGHRDGQWLAVHAGRFEDGEQIHLRGLHYKLVSSEVVKPNGLPYVNTDADWQWLGEHAAKAARWLGYVPFGQIRDARNAAPIIRLFVEGDPEPYLSTGVEVEVPAAEDIEPRIGIAGFVGRQPFRLAIFGEKSSLEPTLGPLAQSRQADLYLPTGEISDTLMHTMAETAARDGRPLIVFTVADCDPAGWQMSISIARKLQAFEALHFPGLSFRVYRVGLVPEQVRQYGLPSTPLKATELRADRWRAAHGVAQTEVDALAALRPALLRQIVRDAIAPFYDVSLARRVQQAHEAWRLEAQAALEAQLGPEHIERIRAEAADRLAELADEIAAINAALTIDVGEIELPEVEIPQARVVGSNGLPLIDSAWPWVDQTRALIVSRAYELPGPNTNGGEPLS